MGNQRADAAAENMPTLQKMVQNMIKELTKLQKMPMPYTDKDDDFPLPRMIATGSGGSIIISRKIDQTIMAVADHLMDDDPTLGPKFSRAEWRASVRRAFGPALAPIDLDHDPAKNADTVLAEVKTSLNKQVSAHGVQEFAFGCTLFRNAAVKPFAFGPVRFEARLDWLARKHQEGAVSTVTRCRVERAWSGKALRKRKPSYDSIGETDILDVIGGCSFACSIETDGLAAEAGRERALTAARLATAAIALLWQTPSKALEGINLQFDRSPHRRKALTFIPGKIVLAGSSWSHMPHGPWLKAGEWEDFLKEDTDYFAVVGEILDYVVNPTGSVARPRLMNTLAQALLWFHEGCREPVTLMAIVKFSASLDALACGRKSSGIRRLINARLGIQDNMTIRPDGPTLKQAIDEIYSDGRSRTVHGTNMKLGYDWMTTRSLAEQFGQLCLRASIDWAAKNPTSDDPLKLSR